VQIDYTDYRDVNGIKFPFEIKFSWLDGKYTRADQGTSNKRHYRRGEVRERRELVKSKTKDSDVLYINRTLDIAWRTGIVLHRYSFLISGEVR